MGAVARQIVNLVNPRLALYTNAGILAAVILILNYAVVAGLALVLVERCTEVTTVDRTEPITSGDRLVFENFILKTIAREGVVRSGPVTVTTNVSGCFKKSAMTIVAPHPMLTFYRDSFSLPSTMYEPYLETGVAVAVPCWDEAITCTNPAHDGEFYAQDPRQRPTAEGLGCNSYHALGSDANEVASAEKRALFADLAAKLDRFPWCSHEEEWEQRHAFIRNKDLKSDKYGRNVSLAVTCGNALNIAPAGVHSTGVGTVNIDPPGLQRYGKYWTTMTPFTSYWDLNVTTTTKTCPTFFAAFANAFAYTAQIEILITMVLLFVSKKAGVVKNAEGVVDFGAGVVGKQQASKLRDLEAHTAAKV